MTWPAQPAHGREDTTDSTAADALRAVVLGVDGVTAVFPSRPLWQRLPAGALSLLQGGAADAEDGPLVEGGGTGPLQVTVRLGVSDSARTPDVVRAVASAVRGHLAPAEVSVSVTVARISAE